MKYVVCFSGGHSSAISSIETVRRYGKEMDRAGRYTFLRQIVPINLCEVPPSCTCNTTEK